MSRPSLPSTLSQACPGPTLFSSMALLTWENADTLPTHATPADMRTSYATDTTAVGGEPPINKYGNAAACGNAPVSNGYQTTTTTNAPAVAGNGVSHDGYVRTQQPYHQNSTGTF